MQLNTLFGKNESKAIKGIAIIMMFWNHLFMHPDMLVNNYWTSMLMLPNGISVEEFLSPVFHICVPIYIFIAGYGFAIKFIGMDGNIDNFLRSIKNLYKKYWLVFIFVIPILAQKKVITIKVFELIGNFAGYLSTYVGEWWFFSLYVELMVIAFLMRSILKRLNIKQLIWGSIIICCCGYALYYVFNSIAIFKMIAESTLWGQIYYILIKQPIFICGIIFFRKELFANIYAKMKGKYYLYLLTFLILCTGVYLPVPETFYDVIVVAAFILLLCVTFNRFNILLRIFVKIGNYSTYMWLTHSVLIFYLLQNQIYKFHFSLSCVAMTFLFALFVSICFNYIDAGSTKVIGKLERIIKMRN